MKQLWAFLTQLDKQAVRACLVLTVMFAVVLAMMLYGKNILDFEQADIAGFFEAVKTSGWGLPTAILIFSVAAFLGVPQWVLIAAVVVAFGPVTGSAYAWVSTLISASLNFWLGRWMGAERLSRISGGMVDRIISIVRKNGFVTSFTVRLVPTGPFVMVNMAAGVSRMTFPAFAAGTGLGIIPKILIVALIGQGVLTDAQGPLYMAIFVGLALSVMLIMLFARRRLRAQSTQQVQKLSE